MQSFVGKTAEFIRTKWYLIAITLLAIVFTVYFFRDVKPAPPKVKTSSSPEFVFEAKNELFTAYIGDTDSKRPFVSFTSKAGGNVAFRFDGETDAKVEEQDNKIIYRNVNNNSDIVYTPLANGIKEEIILNQPIESAEYLFDIFTTGAAPRKTLENTYSRYFYNEDGIYQFHLEKPFAVDARGQRMDEIYTQIRQSEAEEGRYQIVLVLPKEWLHDKARSFPITIDPTFIYDTTAEFAAGQLNRLKDTGPGASATLESYYQELPADEYTVGLWHFNEASGNVLDSSGNGRTGTPTGTTVIAGKINNARNFTGADDISLGSQAMVDSLPSVTVEAWIYPTAQTAATHFRAYSEENVLYVGQYENQASFYMGNGASWVTGEGTGGTLPINQWSHVAWVKNGLNYYIYINGELTKSATTTVATLGTSSNINYISSNDGTTQPWAGSIDDMRISSVAKTAEQIKSAASRRPYSVYTSDVLAFNPPITSWDPLLWSELGVATGDGETLKDTTGLVAQWNFNETSGTSVAKNAGSCVNPCNGGLAGFDSTDSQDANPDSSWTANNRRWGAGAVQFDGINSYVGFSDHSSLDFTDSFSLSAWIKTTQTPTAGLYPAIMGKGFLTNSTNGYGIFLNGDVGGRIACQVRNDATISSLNGDLVNDGDWHYVVCTRNHTTDTTSLYLDGVLQGTQVTDLPLGYSNSQQFIIGMREASNSTLAFPYKGVIDTATVFSRVLTPPEIMSNYQAGNIEFQTRVGSDTSPDDGSWEEWRPVTGETAISSLDSDAVNWQLDQPSANPESCKDILDQGLSDGDGTYTIQLGGQATSVYCDMTTNGGGWTLVANVAPTDGNSVGYNNQAFWTTKAEYGTYANKLANDYKSPAAYLLPSDELMIVSANTGASGSVLGWRQWPLANRPFSSLFSTNIATVHTATCSTGSSTAVSTGTTSTWDDIIRQGTCLYSDANFSASGIADLMRLSTISYNGTDNNMAGFASSIDAGALWQGATNPYMGMDRSPCNSTSCTYATICKMASMDCLGNYCTASYASTGGTCGTSWNSRFYVRAKKYNFSKSNTTTNKIEGTGALKIQTGTLSVDPYTVGLWRLDETGGTGAYLKDSTTNALNGTPTGTSVVNGVTGKARSFNGSSNYINIGDTPLVDFGSGNFALEAWIKRGAVTGTTQIIVGKDNSTGNARQLFLTIINTNMVRIYYATAGDANVYLETTATIADTNWHHVLGQRNGNSFDIYIDGKLSASGTSVGTHGAMQATTASVRIGSREYSASEGYFNGIIDEVRVSSAARSAGEIAESYRLGRDRYFNKVVSSTDLSSKSSVPFYIAADRPGTYLTLTAGESLFANYQPDSNTAGLWHLDDTLPGFTKTAYVCTGANQTYTVPAGVSQVSAKVWGAGGGGGSPGGWTYGFAGGGGGYVSGDIRVSPGQALTIVAACGGVNGTTSGTAQAYGGGGRACISATDCRYAGGGGGGSGVYYSNSYILLAGGGGGGGSSRATNGQQGGAGGGDLGRDGSSYTTTARGRGGDTWSGGGAGGTGTYAGTAGISIYGGNAGANSYGAGGGGGYFGGGGGAYLEPNDMGGGGGGSSYFSNSASLGVMNASTIGGSGVTPGNSTDSDNLDYGYGGAASVNGVSGRVVISVPNQTQDSSGLGNHSYLNGSTSVLGKIGNGRSFNGTSDHISCSDTDCGGTNKLDFSGTGSLTTSAWIKTSSAARQFFLAKFSHVFTGRGYGFATNAGKLYAEISKNDASTTNVTSTGALVNDNNWHHVVMVYTYVTDGTSVVSFYVDGKLDYQITNAVGPIQNSVSDFTIGRRDYWGFLDYFTGTIDEVRVDSVARTATEIRQAYEVGLRTHPITIDFGAKLDSGNLITGSGDLSFTVDATYYGLQNKGDMLFKGDKIIVRENYNGTEYIAQGTVTAVTASTGAVTVSAWDSGSTFHGSGYTADASIFKWQREYWSINNATLDSHVDAITSLTLRLTDGSEGRTFWLDDLRSTDNYLTDPTGSTITSSTGNLYLQYRAILTSTDKFATATLSGVTVTGTSNLPLAPSSLTATSLSPTSVRWDFTDNSSNEDGFKLFDYSGNYLNFSSGVGVTSITQTGQTPGTERSTKVAAYNSYGNSILSSSTIGYTFANVPIMNPITRTSTSAVVSFDYNSNGVGTIFAVYMEEGNTCDGTGGNYLTSNGANNGSSPDWNTYINWGSGQNHEFTVSNLNPEKSYSFCAKALYNSVQTAFSPPGLTNAKVIPQSGDLTIDTENTSFLNRYRDGNDPDRYIIGLDTATDANSPNSSQVNLTGGSLTLNSDETLVAGKLIFDGGTLFLAATGSRIAPGAKLWAIDRDEDGFPDITNGEVRLWYGDAPQFGRRKALLSTLATIDCSDINPSANNVCIPKRDITITNAGGTLTNYDVVFTLDTATLISAGKMTADCGDIRIHDSDDVTELTYWIEGGCNTAYTQVWVRVPSIPNGTKTIYAIYDGSTTTNGYTAWSGSFLMLNNAACPTGWSRNTTFDTRLPYGNATTFGTTGGSATHNHANETGNTGGGATGNALTGAGSTILIPNHTHGVTYTISNVTQYPPYLRMPFCSSSNLDIDTGLIGLFDATVPTGWTRFTSLDGRYPYSSDTYGTTAGSATHTHTMVNTVFGGPSAAGFENAGPADSDHAHTNHSHNLSNGTTNSGNNEPPYITMIFGSINATGAAPSGLVNIVTALPPYGWTQFSALDSKFPKGSATYGSVSGGTSHNHTYSKTSPGPNSTSSSRSGGSGMASVSHTHTFSGTTNSPANASMPPYATMIFAKRNTPTATTSVGAEHY